MAINLSDNININAPKIADKRYGPWSSVNDANTNVPSPQRAQGLTVGILSGSGIVEYWYYSGITDTDLVFKTGGGTGESGTSGTSGTSGIDGTSGTSGIDGTSGTSGIDGTSGTSGESGTSGTSGVSGTSGTSGIDGTSGTSGIDGTSGTSGISGTSGTSGTSGVSGSVYSATSTSELTISGGTQTLTVLTGLSYTPGQTLIVTNSGNTANMTGTVTSYNPTTGELVLDVVSTTGSGTYSDWDINLSGASGVSGTSGTSGTSPGSAFDELYYDSDTKTLHVPNISLTGGTITVDNLPVTGDDPGNRLVLSGDTVYLFTGETTGSTSINLLEYGGLDVVSGDTYFTRFDSSLDPSLSVPNTIGGIASGTTVAQLTGKTLVQLFNDLLFPTVQPTYTIPVITMSGVVNVTVEVGTLYSANISGYGNKNDAGQFTQLRILRNGSPIATYTGTGLTQSSITDIAAQFGYTDPNNPNYRYTINPATYSESYTIPSGATSSTLYRLDGNYDAGLSKQDNKGNYDARTPAVRTANAPQAAENNFLSAQYTVSSIFPYFYGVFPTGTTPTAEMIATAISGGTEGVDYFKVLSSSGSTGTISVDYDIYPEYKIMWVAYPATYTTKTRWYITELNTALMGPTEFVTSAVTHNIDSPEDYWKGISFKLHWSNWASTQQENLQFRVS